MGITCMFVGLSGFLIGEGQAYFSALQSRLFSSADVDERSPRVRSLVGDQPEDGGRYLILTSSTTHRSERLHAIDACRLAAARMDVGVDEARRDAVDPNALPPDFPGESNRG